MTLHDDGEIADDARAAIRDVPDFPIGGIVFKDITPLLADPRLVRRVVQAMASPFATAGVTHVVGIESRGFLFGVPVALSLNAAFVPARKPGKLPHTTHRETFSLEYGSDALEIHIDALDQQAVVLIVDDVLATGGTAAAAIRLVGRLGGQVAGVAVLVELRSLGGRERLRSARVQSIVSY